MARRQRTPLLVLLASLALTVAATLFVALTGRQRDDARFLNAVQSTEDRIRRRLELYAMILRGGAGFLVAEDSVTRTEFRDYVRRLSLQRWAPGIQGMGFTRVIRSGEVARVEEAVRREGFPEFRIWPDGARDLVTAIVLLEPDDRRNRIALGFDMSTEPVRRAAMLQARDSARATLSGKVRLVQEIDPAKQAGFLIYAPVFDRPQAPATIAERRATLRGWVYAPFRADDMFAGIFGTESEPRVRFRVYDGDSVTAEALLHDSNVDGPPARIGEFRTVRRLEMLGRRWTITFTGLPALEQDASHAMAVAIALAGLVVSLVLYALARAQAVAQRRAEESDALRARFFAAMSHELRTPLNAIIGYNDLLLAGVFGEMPEPQRGSVERSQRAAKHLHDLVNDVLDLSKLEAGKMEISVERVDLAALMEDLAATVRPMTENAGSALHVDCAPNTPAVETDPRRLRQILLNLLSNAAKFGRARPIALHCRPHGEHGAVIEVRDQGIGIAPEHQARIFEEFEQVIESGDAGTGLGLAISSRLAERLGGSLTVESEVGVGSTFRLLLPGVAPR